MIGPNSPEQQPALFSYRVNLHQRLSSDHPLRAIAQALDLSFVVPSVRHFYGRSGNVSVDPVIIVKLMFLLFYYNIPSERELMEQLRYRLDFLWFLGLDLDSAIPHHSVLSKARARWGEGVFERLFVRTVEPCVQAGLVAGRLAHVDSTMVRAEAAKDSVVQTSPWLQEALRQAYQPQQGKLEGLPPVAEAARAAQPTTPGQRAPAPSEPGPILEEPAPSSPPEPAPPEPVSVKVLPPAPKFSGPAADQANPPFGLVSLTDPEAELARSKKGVIEPSYKEHRLVDDQHGVITAVQATRAHVHDGSQLSALLAQQRENTGIKSARLTVAGDQHYGTIDNFLACQKAGLTAHLSPAQAHLEGHGKFPVEKFAYQPAEDRYQCPAGHYLERLQKDPDRALVIYRISEAQICACCPLQKNCTTGKQGRSVARHNDQELIDQARRAAKGPAARYSRKRRKHVMEGSFADAANNHGLKRARWRGLSKQRLQSWLICAVQNIKRLARQTARTRKKAAQAAAVHLENATNAVLLPLLLATILWSSHREDHWA